jgi:TPR repeat protein
MKKNLLRALLIFCLIPLPVFAGDLFHEDLAKVTDMAKQGNPEAQVELGARYSSGRNGVNQDYRQSMEWYRKAADQNYSTAQLAIGQLYFDGGGVAKNDAEALKWVKKAADIGDPRGALAVGLSHLKGIGTPVNFQKALRWIQQAAQYDYPKAEFYMGTLYEDGRGVSQNMAMAYAWYELVPQGSPSSSRGQKRRNALKAKLSPDRIKEALLISNKIKSEQKPMPKRFR